MLSPRCHFPEAILPSPDANSAKPEDNFELLVGDQMALVHSMNPVLRLVPYNERKNGNSGGKLTNVCKQYAQAHNAQAHSAALQAKSCNDRSL